MKKIGVVILNYKVKDLTLKCINSVKASSYKDFFIVVVDNDSGDEIEEALSNIKDVTFIQNSKNTGYSGGNNVGIKRALELGADLVFILNPDTTINKNCLEILVEGLERYQAGIANPKIYFMDSDVLWFAGKILDLKNVLGRHRGVDQKDRGQFDEEIEMEDAVGAAMLVKKEVFQKIGFFDEKYFLYYEDSDFCFRARKKGFKIIYIPKAVVYHKNAQSTGLGSPLQDYYITRNRMLFASKFLSLRTKFALFREALRNWSYPVRRKAFLDFLIGNFGKGNY